MVEKSQLLAAVVDRIIPGDRDPGAKALGTDRYVEGFLVANPADALPIWAGFSDLAGACPDFCQLTSDRQDQMLQALEATPWFQRLVTITSEGFYADPDNGGNAGAGSWTMMGYRHGLPEGPSGPPRSKGAK
ncbi:gluconate 2-dehydrogenase subunit 3 family protein [Devosia sp. 2618]|uniref:gluconate 2-dehydrogenase subunit 3 family protein n=1 Tax=Devosia sp. 2618 TaxID=3156454 RepID=UPI003396A084